MGKKLMEPKTSKTMESKSIKIMEPNSSKNVEAKSPTRKMKKKIIDNDIPTREFCNLCTSKPAAKRPIFNLFNLPIETTTNTASCQVKSCYITVRHTEETVQVPECAVEDTESLKASLSFDFYRHRKLRRSKTSSQCIRDHQLEQEEKLQLAQNKKKMEDLMGFNNNKSNTELQNIDRVGPHWYQELSNTQMAYMNVLECALIADWEENVLTRLHRILAGLGILPQPTNRQVASAVQMSYFSPILFLAHLYKLTTSNLPWNDLRYSVNDRLLLSGLAYLAIPITIADLEWRIPFEYPKRKLPATDFNTKIPEAVTHFATKRHPHTSPYVEPLPYFVHRLRFEKDIIAAKERRIKMAKRPPPAVIQAQRPPCLQRRVSEDPEPKVVEDIEETSYLLPLNTPPETPVDTQSLKSTESNPSKPIVKISSSPSQKSSNPKSARFKINSNEKLNTRADNPDLTMPRSKVNPEDEEEVEIRQLGPDSVSVMENEKEKNYDADGSSLNSAALTKERSKEEVLQINKKRSRQVKSEPETPKTVIVDIHLPEPGLTNASIPCIPSIPSMSNSTVVEPQCIEVEDLVEEVKVREASNTVFGTLEQVYSIALIRIDETTAHVVGKKAPEEPPQETKKNKKCLCAEELEAEKLKQDLSATSGTERPTPDTNETVEQQLSQSLESEECQPLNPSGSGECQPVATTLDAEQQSLRDDLPSSNSSFLDPILTENALWAVLNGYWAGFYVGNDDEETNEKLTKKNKSLDKSLKDALSTMGLEGNILASLPHSNKLPTITQWLKYRKGHELTEENRDSLLRHSKAQWDIKRMHARKVRVPHLLFKLGHHDWSHKNSVVKQVQERYSKYYADVRQALVHDAREYWPTMEMNNFYNPYFKNVFFAYLSSKEVDCVQTQLVF